MRAYNMLLHLYPSSFRHEYGGEMRTLFAERRKQASSPWRVATFKAIRPGERPGRDSSHRSSEYKDRPYATFFITEATLVLIGSAVSVATFWASVVNSLVWPESDSN